MGRFCYLAGIVGLSCSFLQSGTARGNEASWAGAGHYRILVKVDGVDIADRFNDEMVALCDIDFRKRMPSLPENQIVDLHTVQVIKYSPTSGEPEAYAMNYYQHSPYDRPWRFYDRSLLDDFPTFRGYISLDKLRGRPLFRTTNLPFGHRYFNPLGDGRQGKIVWAHTQEGDSPSHYGIYFDLLPPDTQPRVPPAGFIGDGSNRVVKQGSQCGPPANYRGCAIDWDDDGRSDILYATMSGYLVLYLNTGTPEAPEFKIRRLLCDTDGKPIDVGFCSCAHVTDWNNDGTRDLLIGAGKGCILYYRNQGTNKAPQMSFSGFVETDGQMLVTPNWPIAELAGKKPGEVFKQDYVAMPCAVDWDGDGDRDLLAGGWVTGMVFYHENVGSNDDGTPILTARGPLEVDGKPLDTMWGAAPVAVDLDDDGDLDLICGAKPMTPDGGDFNDPDRILYYFENVGTRRQPRLEHRPFPMTGQLSTGSTAMASVVDWNHDGLLDLVLITHGSSEAYFIKNIGSREKPLFDMNVGPSLGYWNGKQLPRGRFVDWNKDGHPDIVSTWDVMLNSGKGMPGFFEEKLNLFQGGRIQHPVPHGDENYAAILYDVDRDGVYDCVYGAHSGYIWLHQNNGTNDKPDWDFEGYRLQLASGKNIKVGLPEGVEPDKFNYRVLQGARAKPAPGDYNQDGLTDLVVCDTFGKTRYFENVGTRAEPRFADPKLIFEYGNRLNVTIGDWNADGYPDVFVITGSKVQLLENKGAGDFKGPQPLDLPRTLGDISSVSVVDYNQDGDTDILLHMSSRLSCFVERSFVKFGYRSAEVLSAERRSH